MINPIRTTTPLLQSDGMWAVKVPMEDLRNAYGRESWGSNSNKTGLRLPSSSESLMDVKHEPTKKKAILTLKDSKGQTRTETLSYGTLIEVTTNFMKDGHETKLAKLLHDIRTLVSHSQGSASAYEDDQVKIQIHPSSLEMEIERKENRNPVIMMDAVGNIFRYHGEFTYVEKHLRKLLTLFKAIGEIHKTGEELPCLSQIVREVEKISDEPPDDTETIRKSLMSLAGAMILSYGATDVFVRNDWSELT